MERLTIGAVANLTGVPTHTLRKWESRHSIVTPNRSESGRRFYTNEHVQRLLLVKSCCRAPASSQQGPLVLALALGRFY